MDTVSTPHQGTPPPPPPPPPPADSTTGLLLPTNTTTSNSPQTSSFQLPSQSSTFTHQHPGRPSSLRSSSASYAPSISSVLSSATTVTPDAPPHHRQRGFKTREAYLAALDEFAEGKLYMDAHEQTLYGWYGGNTVEMYKGRPGLRGEKGKARRKRDQAVGVGGVGGAGGDESGGGGVISDAPRVQGQSQPDGDSNNTAAASRLDDGARVQRPKEGGRMRRLSRVFSGGAGNAGRTVG